MQKLLTLCTLLATAAPACAVEIADTGIEVYGSLRIMLEQKKDSDDTEYKDALSRVGIKGSYTLDERLSAFAKYEVGLDLGNDGDTVGDMRYGHIGLTDTTYGTLALGKVDSPFYETVGIAADYMWWNSAPVYYTLDGGLRVSESAYYSSPDMGGLKVKALYQVDNEDNAGQEQTQIGATYSLGNLTLGTAFTGTEGGNDRYGLSRTTPAKASISTAPISTRKTAVPVSMPLSASRQARTCTRWACPTSRPRTAMAILPPRFSLTSALYMSRL